MTTDHGSPDLPKYFSDYRQVGESEDERTAEPRRPVDAGGDALPFDHLGDRRFEILTFRLKMIETRPTGHRVRLMQGVGEKGRDVVVHDSAGRLRAIIQCKLLRDRLGAPDLKRELLKLALHAFRERSVLDNAVIDYELWCPGDLTAPAAELLDQWLRGWTEESIAAEAKTVIGTYKAFAGTDWATAKTFVLETFPRLIKPRHVNAVEISDFVRRDTRIHEFFFQFKSVMASEDVESAIRRAMSEFSGYVQLSDKDAKHVLDRIASFSETERLGLGGGYVMGLKAELVSKFTDDEFKEFLNHAIKAAFGIQAVVLKACARLAFKKASELIPFISPQHRNLPAVLVPLFSLSMMTRLTSKSLGRYGRPDMFPKYEKLALEERIALHTSELWDSYEACIANYDPAKHAAGSDEERRYQIGLAGKNGATTREQYLASIQEGVEQHRVRIRQMFDEWMALIPTDIMVISEGGFLGNEFVAKRLKETITTVEALRMGQPRDT